MTFKRSVNTTLIPFVFLSLILNRKIKNHHANNNNQQQLNTNNTTTTNNVNTTNTTFNQNITLRNATTISTTDKIIQFLSLLIYNNNI
ncbi:hypothetical protein ABK040_010739 [Willaertia magna]